MYFIVNHYIFLINCRIGSELSRRNLPEHAVRKQRHVAMEIENTGQQQIRISQIYRTEDKNIMIIQLGTQEICSSSQNHEKQCPCFSVFISVLLKYLKNQGDLEAYETLKKRVQPRIDCATTNGQSFQCAARAVLEDLPRIVKPSDLRRVRCYLRHRVQQKKQRQNKQPSCVTTTVRCNLFGISHDVSAWIPVLRYLTPLSSSVNWSLLRRRTHHSSVLKNSSRSSP